MAVNKVDYRDSTLIDLTSDTVTADNLIKGVTAHNKAGNKITGTYTKPSGTLNIESNGNFNVSGYANVNVNISLKWANYTVTGASDGTLNIAGIPFYPLGYVAFPSGGQSFANAQIIAAGWANGRLGVYPNKFSTSSVSTVQPYPEFEVSADGNNYKVKAYHGSSKFKNIQYTVRLWGI